MSRRVLTLICVVGIGLLLREPPRVVEGLGFNTGMAYRYPWSGAITMTRTQGWGGATSHTGDLHYSVDWDDGSGNWLVRAANGGEISCDREGGLQAGLGNYVGVFNGVSNQMAITAHLANCGYFEPGVSYEGTQGQGLALAGETGNASGIHLHFHVILGANLTGGHTTVPFEMSDKNDFAGAGSDGPSDNVYIGDDGVGGTNGIIRSAYLSIGGGASAAWWNIGATYRSVNDNADEFGGVCRNTAVAFVHTCASNFGSGITTSQNYIDWKGVRHSIYYTSNYAGHVKGQIQGALSNAYHGPALSKVMGAPTGAESNGIQNFEGGQIQRRTDLPGVQIDVSICSQFGCALTAYMRWSAYGVFCPSVTADRVVNNGDLLAVALHLTGIGTPYDLFYDLNLDGVVNNSDLLLVALRLSTSCAVVDP